jgi:hypothetical protein
MKISIFQIRLIYGVLLVILMFFSMIYGYEHNRPIPVPLLRVFAITVFITMFLERKRKIEKVSMGIGFAWGIVFLLAVLFPSIYDVLVVFTEGVFGL